MKFYVILIATYTDGRADKVAVYTYGTEDEAIKNAYVYLGQYVNEQNVATVCVEAKNNVGGVYKHETWTKAEQ